MTRRTRFRVGSAALLGAGIACSSGVPSPARLDTANDTCSVCRMAVSDPHLAAQILERGEEPRFFDDLGCLRKYLDEHPLRDAAIYVADHRTGEWTLAKSAVYSRLVRASTPMASGLVAHATPESRAQDAGAAASTIVEAEIVVGPSRVGERSQP